MGKLREQIWYIYSLIIIMFFLFFIGKIDGLSANVLTSFRDELIPLSCRENEKGMWVMEEFFPIHAYMGNDFDEYEETWNENNQYDYDNLVVDTEKQLATMTDSVNDDANVTEASTVPIAPGTVYTMEQLCDYNFLLSNCYVVDTSTSVNPDELDGEILLSKDMTVDLSGDDYKVLIYHTHGSETFADSRPGVIEDTVIGVGDELTRVLEEDYGIKVYHDRNVYDMVDGVLDRSYAYTLSGEGVDEILKEYPSIEVILDIHRDGVNEDLHLMKVVDGKPTAQIMFLNGMSRLNKNGDIDYLYNPYKIDNLSFSLQMYLAGKQMYGDLMRRIYISGYCYNLNKMPKASLIEVGAQTNTVEEVKNAMTPLAAIIYRVLSQK